MQKTCKQTHPMYALSTPVIFTLTKAGNRFNNKLMEPDSQNKIYFQQYYKGKSDDEMMKEISHEGFDPLRIINEPGYIYSQHEHPETKILAFLSGSMDVK